MRILHLIDSLDHGGAESLLMGYIPLLDEHEHLVVTLHGPNVYSTAGYEFVQLDTQPLKDFLKTVSSLRKIIKERNIDIVHSHSFWTNIISRLATAKKIRLFNHYHFADYDTMKNKMSVKRMILVDRMTSWRKITRIAVSEYVAGILTRTFPKSTIAIIPNFIDCGSGGFHKPATVGNMLRVVAVGNCNLEKNYLLILEAFEALKDHPISLDIIGSGSRLEYYREMAGRMNLGNVRFCGHVSNVKERLTAYDLFLSASNSETFGIAVLEAVCAKLPLLLSDIPAFKEIAPSDTLFFRKNDKYDLVNKLLFFAHNQPPVDQFEYNSVLQKYTATAFLRKLRTVYVG